MLSIPPVQTTLTSPHIRITVLGVGGAGGNIVNSIAAERIAGVALLALNTDTQALRAVHADGWLALGPQLTRGLGAGGDPLIGQRAAEESAASLRALLQQSDMVCIAAGMGGGTGSGAAPLIAAMAREAGALTIAMITRPFQVEGKRRNAVAAQGIAQLRSIADTVISIPNDRLLQTAARGLTLQRAFGRADLVLRAGLAGLAELIARPGLINVDFADIRAVLGEAGPALLGIGAAAGPDRAVEAMRRAMACPLLEGRLEGARRLLINISGGPDLSLYEVQRAAELVTRTVDENANIIFGATVEADRPDQHVRVTLIASDVQATLGQAAPPPARTALPVPDTLLRELLPSGATHRT